MTQYEVRTNDVAELNIQDAYLWYLQRSPELAHRWIVGLNKSLESLSVMPQRCPLADDSDASEEVKIRKHIYGRFRILFHIIEPDKDENGVVVVVRVIHGAGSMI